MITRYKSEDFKSVFIPAHSFDGEISIENGIGTFDKPKENPHPGFPFLVRVGGGWRSFEKRSQAKIYFREE